MKRLVPITIAILFVGALIVGVAYEQCEPGPGASTGKPAGLRSAADPFTDPPPAARGQVSLRGRVIGPDGKPAAGASVIAVEAEGSVLSARSCRCGGQVMNGQSLVGCPCDSEALIAAVANREGEPQLLARAQSGADGEFELTGLSDAAVALWAQHPSLGVALREKVKADEHPELFLAPALEVTGTVTDTHDKPLAGALVTVIAEPSSRFFEAVTDAAGAFKRGGLPHTALRVVTSLKGYSTDVSALEPDETLSLKVQLTAPSKVAGKVVRRGEPVEGATVRALDPTHDTPLTTVSGPDGTFQLELLRLPVLRLEAAKGFEIASLGLYDPNEDATQLVLELKPAGKVEGAVVDSDGTPISGAEVWVSIGERESQDARSGADGHFEILALAGEGSLQARQPGFLEAEPVKLVVEAGKVKQANVTLSRGAVVEGQVLDPSGKPVAGAFVAEDELSIRQKNGARARYSMSTGADGRFRLSGLDPGKVALLVKHERWKFKWLTVDAPAKELEVRLEAGAAVEGNVREADGSPVVGARVAAVPDDKIDMRGTGGGHSLLDVKETRTRGDGSYRLEGVEPRSYLFTGRDQPTSRTTMARAVVSSGANTVELAFEAALPFGGTVVDQDGKPLSGAQIGAVSWPHEVPAEHLAKRNRDVSELFAESSPHRQTQTDAQGRFFFKAVPPGKLRLSVYADGYRSEDPKDFSSGDTEVKVVLRREPRVSGTVVGPDRAPLTHFFAAGQEIHDPAGHFDVPREEITRLQVVADGFAPAIIELPEGTGDRDVGTVRLSRGRTVEVHITDARIGTPIEGVRALVRAGATYLAGSGMDETVEGEVSDAKGVLPLSRLPEGELAAELQKEGYLPASISLPAGATTAEAKLDPGERIEGRVLDDKGKPVPRVYVRALDEGDTAGYGTTGSDGHFALTGLSAGAYVVSAEEHGRKLTFVPKPVKLEAGTPAVVELRAMAGGASLDVRLFDGGGDELMAQVRLVQGPLDAPLTRDAYRRARESELTPAAPNGHFTGLEPGTYTAVIIAGIPSGNLYKPGVFTQVVEVAPGENTAKVVITPATPHLELSE